MRHRHTKKCNKKCNKTHKGYKKHNNKTKKRHNHMKGGNNGIVANSSLAPNETLKLDNVPGPFIGNSYDGGAESTWPGVSGSPNGITQANYYALNNGYDTKADPVGYTEITNLGNQNGGMLRNSLRRVVSEGARSFKKVAPELVKQGKELGKELGKDLADKGVKRTVKGSPMTPFTNKVNKLSSVAQSELKSVKKTLFGGKKRKTSKRRGGSTNNDKNLQNLQGTSRRSARRNNETRGRVRRTNSGRVTGAIPTHDNRFLNVDQAEFALTRHLGSSEEGFFLKEFIKDYVRDLWGFEGRPSWTRQRWESEITRLVNNEDDLMWNLNEMNLLPTQGAEQDHREYELLRNAWVNYNVRQEGGGLIPQDLVNLGRSVTTGLGNVYNSVSGNSLTASPLPYQDQPIANKAPILVNMPPNYGEIYKNSNLEVGSIN
jgi:hypothetical protein